MILKENYFTKDLQSITLNREGIGHPWEHSFPMAMTAETISKVVQKLHWNISCFIAKYHLGTLNEFCLNSNGYIKVVIKGSFSKSSNTGHLPSLKELFKIHTETITKASDDDFDKTKQTIGTLTDDSDFSRLTGLLALYGVCSFGYSVEYNNDDVVNEISFSMKCENACSFNSDGSLKAFPLSQIRLIMRKMNAQLHVFTMGNISFSVENLKITRNGEVKATLKYHEKDEWGSLDRIVDEETLKKQFEIIGTTRNEGPLFICSTAKNRQMIINTLSAAIPSILFDEARSNMYKNGMFVIKAMDITIRDANEIFNLPEPPKHTYISY